MSKLFIVIGAVLCGTSVILGAFAAHGLKKTLSENLLNAFQTGVTYQMYHGLALLVLALLIKSYPELKLQNIGFLMLGGVVLFSGSLYMLAIAQQKFWGPVTPIGGVLMIASWGWLIWKFIK